MEFSLIFYSERLWIWEAQLIGWIYLCALETEKGSAQSEIVWIELFKNLTNVQSCCGCCCCTVFVSFNLSCLSRGSLQGDSVGVLYSSLSDV